MNGNANGTRRLIRMELEFKNKSYMFNINPENYSLKLSNRANVVYTKGGAFIDLFGEGIKEINFVGTTGFGQDKETGYNKIMELKELIENNFNDISNGKEIKDFLNFYNHTDGEAYVVIPLNFEISRNISQPLLYKYDFSAYAIRRLGDPVPTSNVQMIGNPLNIPNTGTETVNDNDIETENDKVFTEDNKNKKDINIKYEKEMN